MRRRQRALGARVALLAVGLLACGGSAVDVGVRGPAGVSFRDAPDAFMLAVAQGVLGGDPQTGCLWFDDDLGRRVPLVVEHDSASADFTTSPPTVRDGDEVWAAFGQHVRLSGGYVGVDAAVPECAAAGAPFVTSSVRTGR